MVADYLSASPAVRSDEPEEMIAPTSPSARHHSQAAAPVVSLPSSLSLAAAPAISLPAPVNQHSLSSSAADPFVSLPSLYRPLDQLSQKFALLSKAIETAREDVVTKKSALAKAESRLQKLTTLVAQSKREEDLMREKIMTAMDAWVDAFQARLSSLEVGAAT